MWTVVERYSEQEEIKVSIVSLCKLTQKFRLYNSHLQAILGEEHLRFIDDTKMTGTKVHRSSPPSQYCEESTSRVGLDQQKNSALISEQRCKELERHTDVIWTDECTVQLEPHRKRLYDSLDGLNIWGGILQPALIATRYTDILDAALVPLLNAQSSDGHRDNDPKHTSRWSQEYFRENEINWFRTPASKT